MRLGSVILASALALTFAAASLAQQPPAQPSLPCHERPTADVLQEAGPDAVAVVCDGVTKATVKVGNVTQQAQQKFTLVEQLSGKPIADKTIHTRYTYFDPAERAIKQGERVIWILRRIEGGWSGVKALADTPENRAAATPKPTAPAPAAK